jgi:hypothetical protein
LTPVFVAYSSIHLAYSGAGKVAPAPVKSAPLDVDATVPDELVVFAFDDSDLQPPTAKATPMNVIQRRRT